MKAIETDSLLEILRELRKHPAEVVLEKAKSTYNYVNWTKGRLPHSQDKGCLSSDIAKLKNDNTTFKNYILHPDDNLTLITSDNFYFKFSNR